MRSRDFNIGCLCVLLLSIIVPILPYKCNEIFYVWQLAFRRAFKSKNHLNNVFRTSLAIHMWTKTNIRKNTNHNTVFDLNALWFYIATLCYLACAFISLMSDTASFQLKITILTAFLSLLCCEVSWMWRFPFHEYQWVSLLMTPHQKYSKIPNCKINVITYCMWKGISGCNGSWREYLQRK